MERASNAEWQEDLKECHGAITTQSRMLEKTQFSCNTHFADGIGTNPEALLAAAHSRLQNPQHIKKCNIDSAKAQ